MFKSITHKGKKKLKVIYAVFIAVALGLLFISEPCLSDSGVYLEMLNLTWTTFGFLLALLGFLIVLFVGLGILRKVKFQPSRSYFSWALSLIPLLLINLLILLQFLDLLQCGVTPPS